MAQTEHYNFWYLDPDEEISDFPNTWDYNVDKFDAAIYDAATNAVTVGRVPNLPASKTTSGEFAQARIPDLPASQTTTGTFADARIPTSIARTAAVDDETAALKSRIDELELKTRTTGRRDISSLMENADGGAVHVNRFGNLVELSIYGVEPSGEVSTSTTKVFGSSGFPAGFRPVTSMVFPLSTIAPLDPGMITRTYSNGNGRMDMNNPGQPLYGNVTFFTEDAWPSTLPGDPA